MIVVDASVLIDALLDDGSVGEAAREVLADDPAWAAPGHLFVEFLSVLRRRVLRDEVRPVRAGHAVESLGEWEIVWTDPAVTVARTWELRHNVTAFDAAYVAAAEVLDCALVTSDRRLAEASGPRCPVRVVGREMG
ncbi:MAG: type II toxin-antitoxin system VapC family toxin [Pseudonocardiaceae bacterium]